MPQPGRKFNLNARTITAPLAAFCMAGILFVYTRTSIQAAKRNAQKHREADGGQINWHNETLRRHGKLDSPVEESTTVGQLVGAMKDVRSAPVEDDATKIAETDPERKLRERTGKGRGG